MKIEIKPNRGINDLEFGMSRKQVAARWGEAPRIEVDNIMEETREMRHGMVFKYVPTRLKDVLITRNVDAWIFGLPVFRTRNLVERLCEHDTPTPEKGGYVNFYGLGLSLGGFGKKRIPEGRLVIVFAPDRRSFYERFLEA